MKFKNAYSGTSLTVRQTGKSFLATLSFEATKRTAAEEKTLRVKTWSGVEALAKKYNLESV